MNKIFDMEMFLAAVLTGSYSTQQRHLRQARIIQHEISERWQRQTPWAWQKKHLAWFLEHRINQRSDATQYYYLLTVRLLTRRLQKAWKFNRCVRPAAIDPFSLKSANGQKPPSRAKAASGLNYLHN